MAEYIVTSVIDKIASHLIEEAASLASVREQVELIEGELRRMQCFLKDADAKKEADERVKNWVADIRDVAYDTDDVVDTFILTVSQQRRTGLFMFLKRHVFVLGDLVGRHKLNKQINEIRIRICEISDSRSTYGIENIGRGRGGEIFAPNRLQEKRQFALLACEEDIVGLEENIKALESQLIFGDSRRSVISIIGMAGSGKTTLAKEVYLGHEVQKHFDCCVWIYVSQEYRTKDTLHDLGKKIMGLAKADLERRTDEELVGTLSSFLEDKRYLIVLDDIWKCEVWNDLKVAFPDRNNGSRLMITTRYKDVALHADPRSHPHEICLLNDEDSWNLFSKKVGVECNSSTSSPPWSVELGRQMVKRCGGLPLAIVVLAGLLSRKEATFNEWLKVLQSLHWQLRQEPTQCEEILALSYRDLPYYLKSCFLYFGLFPEDFEISARRLILLWVAEGFVQPRGNEPLEDVAEDYLEELIGRSMVQVARRKSDGRTKSCRVHDLLRELSISKAREDLFLDAIYGDVENRFSTRARRLAIHLGALPITKDCLKFRSLLCFDLSESKFKRLKKFKLLRVLDLQGVYLAELSSAIDGLVHLRYLGLRGTWLKKLPSSIFYLLNLQTLDLRSTLINPIPLFIWKLQNLRHLYFSEFKEMVVNPPKNISLANIQTLKGLCITQASCIKDGLDNLSSLRELNLHGELHKQEEALVKWISQLKNLECLKLCQGRRVEGLNNAAIPMSMDFSSHVYLYKLHLEGFLGSLFNIEISPPNLTELSLQGSFLMDDPMPKLEMLPSLRVLKLRQSSYVGREMVCSSGGFPQLQFLKFAFLMLETLKIEEGALGNLRQLEIVECKRVKIVPRGLKPVTTLRELKLGFLPQELELKIQERKGENWYRIQHVPPI